MKSLIVLTLFGVLALAVHVAYDAGERGQRAFQALCEADGVRCLVQLSPAYVESHADMGIEVLPYVTYVWRDSYRDLPRDEWQADVPGGGWQ
jgi:hypothetical protein